jgi:hypothetical protein
MPILSQTCPSCFRRLPTDALFCSRCGSQVRREERGAAPGTGGTSLDRLLRERGPLPIPQVESILRQVGGALVGLHAPPRSVVHGKVSPGTIRVEDGGEVTLANPADNPGDPWEGAGMSTGLVLEDPEYMSPEECRGLAPSPASDQYALGAVAWAMLAGRPPFVGAFYKVVVAHLSEGLVPLLQLRPDCPPALASAVERMLSKDPSQRWTDVAQAVEAALSGAEVSESVALVAVSRLPAPLPALRETPESQEPEGTREPHEPARGQELVRASGSGPEPAESPRDRGPDLGPPPPLPMGIQQEEEDELEEEDEPGGQDRRALFFDPIPPPPEPDPDDFPLDEVEADGSTIDGPAVQGSPGDALDRQEVGAGLVQVPPAPPPAPPPPVRQQIQPRKLPPPRRRRGSLLLLLLVAGAAGWGAWELVEAAGGFREDPPDDAVAWAPDAPLLLSDRDPPPDDYGALLLPPPDRGVQGSGESLDREDWEPLLSNRGSSTDPSPATETAPTDPPAPAAGDPPTGSSPAAAPPPPAQPAPPAPSPTAQAPAPAPPGGLEMNIRPWAHLLVNGVPRGRFQTRAELELPAGTHFVRMTNPNFPPFDTTVVVRGGETTVLNKILQPDDER